MWFRKFFHYVPDGAPERCEQQQLQQNRSRLAPPELASSILFRFFSSPIEASAPEISSFLAVDSLLGEGAAAFKRNPEMAASGNSSRVISHPICAPV